MNYALKRLTLMMLDHATQVTNRTTGCNWLPLVAASRGRPRLILR